MNLFLIRHGDPDYANHTITEKGHRQAALLAESLAPVQIDNLIVSPLGRAQHTADYIIQRKGLEYEVVDFFQELNGRYRDNDYAWEYHASDVWKDAVDINTRNWAQHVPYGEHMVNVYQDCITQFDVFMTRFGLKREGNVYRILQACDETIAIVCHGGVISTLLSHLLHIPLPITYAQFRIDPSSVTRLVLRQKDGIGVFRMISLNDMSHTQSMPEDDLYHTPTSNT